MANFNLYMSQLKAMLKRNILLKNREKRRTLAELLLPIYFLAILIVIKLSLPDPNIPEVITPRGEEGIFTYFSKSESYSIVAIPPNTSDATTFQHFLSEIEKTLTLTSASKTKLNFTTSFTSEKELDDAYDKNPESIPIAVIFNSIDPLNYKIRTNPTYEATPLTSSLYDGVLHCRGGNNPDSALEQGSTCPVNTYYFSGFLALQTLIDYTRIRLDTSNNLMPDLSLEIFPKEKATGDWSVTFRIIVPLYMVLALSQFVTYLMILIVGEKEKKIKEGMKIMGLMDSVFWLSWFIIYACFVLLITIVCVILLYSLKVFTNSSFVLIFIMILLYGLSVIMFAFMVTPFFDKSRTAGVLSSFMLILMSLLYYIQIWVSNTYPGLLWILSLLSPAGFAMAIDKLVYLDMAGIGVNFSNMWNNYGSGLPFGGSMLIVFADIILYGFIAYYLDSVIPSEYGVKRSPFFCFMPSFWCNKSAQIPSNRSNAEESEDMEPISRDLHGKEAIRIINLGKQFKQFRKPTVTALNGVDLTIYEGQITAILGHNGAGKTTLFNILTGLTAPSTGSAYVFGYDVRNPNDMDKIRSMTGVCPQHDILFENLTPREHLEFFAAIKGIKDIKSAVEKTVRDIDLADKIDTASKNLSGGQKRKLSIGIAIIGDPKIIVLDEPTAGVDPFSRRHMWNVLQNVRHGKVILLTTHFMDEADILADRKAVISKGKVRCCGSSLFLKNKFGIGYHLTLVLEENSDEQAIRELIKTYVTTATKDRRHGKELSYILPYDSVKNFAELFAAIEGEISTKSKLGISSYGVSMTTLEEVFLSLQKEEESEEEEHVNGNPSVLTALNVPTVNSSYQQLRDSTSTLDTEREAVATGLRSLESIQCTPTSSRSLSTLIKLRVLRLWREKRKLYFLFFLPIGFAALGLYLNSITYSTVTPSKSSPLSLNPFIYYLPVGIHNGTTSNLDQFTTNLLDVQLNQFDGNFTSLLDTAPRLAAFNVTSFGALENSITVLYNDTEQHSLPILVNLINNAYYGLLSSTQNWNAIKVSTHPFDAKDDASAAVSGGNIVLGMIFLFSPVILAVDMVYDREIKARNQLRVNGLSFWLYFLSFFVVQVGVMTIIMAALIILIVVFKTAFLSSGPALVILIVLVFLYCPSSVLFTTCVSYLFDKTDSAQSVMPNMSMLLGFLPYLPIMLAKQSTARILHITFSFLDVLYIPYGMIHYLEKVQTDCQTDETCTTPTVSDYLTTELVVIFIALLIHIPVWFFLLLICDVKKNGGTVKSLFISKNTVSDIVEDGNEAGDIGVYEDQDVKNERERVKTLIRTRNDKPPVVTVENLHKVYWKDVNSRNCLGDKSESKGNVKIAIKSLSLAVDSGEVFGLLGHNGAGKTTAMKIIIAEEGATRGRVQIAGESITTNVNSAFQLLGYCPQHDAQWKNITVQEHLELYAAMKGVPKNDIDRIVKLYLSGLQIHEHKDKQTDKCSGGTKRKLSYAMAMVGNPKIVLLDEPSTGMDPKSKRFLWDTVLASFKGSKGAILTTHSMEEADALCSRVGIMVKGELRCLGATQHLKNLYGAGYNLEIKLSLSESTNPEEKFTNLQNFVSNLFPHAVLEERFADRLMFSVPQQNVSSLANCFKSLEEAKVTLNIEEYSFSQTTLEQVFLKFAHEGEHEED